MKDFLRGSLTALLQRIERLEALLDRVPAFPPVQQKCEEVRSSLGDLRNQVHETLILLPGPPERLQNIIGQYNAVARQVYLIEQVFVGPVSRFSDDDVRLCRLCERIWKEIGLSDDSPVVVAASTEYFCTHPAFGVIFTPASDSASLVNLSDLYHEIAHHLHQRGHPLFGPRFRAALNTYIDETEDEIKRLSRPVDIGQFRSLIGLWRNWAEEAAADAFAALVLGPAYGWANLHLMLRVPSIFEYSRTHPADAARMEHILRVLSADPARRDQLRSLEQQWKVYRQLPHPQKSEMYDLLHPPALFTAVLEDVREAITQYKVTLFGSTEGTVAYILNEVWLRLSTDPAQYSAWEQEVLKQIFS